MNGPSRHLSWSELSCWNRLGRSFSKIAPGERIAPYPQIWREGRAVHLADTFEELRETLANHPILIHSAYRTADYNRAVGGVGSSQHLQGNALDISHSQVAARELFAMMFDMTRQGKLPRLGGLGSYETFVHMDIRPRVQGRVATWHF